MIPYIIIKIHKIIIQLVSFTFFEKLLTQCFIQKGIVLYCIVKWRSFVVRFRSFIFTMTPSMNERVLQRRKLLNTAKLPERRCHMRPTSRSDDSMVTGVGSQTTTDDVRSFSRIDCETWEESVLSLPVWFLVFFRILVYCVQLRLVR